MKLKILLNEEMVTQSLCDAQKFTQLKLEFWFQGLWIFLTVSVFFHHPWGEPLSFSFLPDTEQQFLTQAGI